MSLSYDPLWHMLYEQNISKMEFAKTIHISNATLAKLGKNEPIALTIIDKICNEFECKIEDVVQHVPDILLDRKKSDLPLDKGCVVLVDFSESPASGELIKPYVILDIKETTINNIDTCQYIAAPIIDTPVHFLSVHFENVPLYGKLSHGWISLDKLENIPSKYFLKIIGKMPETIIEKIDKFISSVDELL